MTSDVKELAMQKGWWIQESTTCVCCPGCGFAYDVSHFEPDREDSCPNCTEESLRAEVERLEAERDEVCRIIAGNTKIANLPPYIQSLCNSLDDAETERDEAVGHLKGLVRYADAVRMNAGIGKNQAERLEAARDFLGKIKKHKEAGADG